MCLLKTANYTGQSQEPQTPDNVIVVLASKTKSPKSNTDSLEEVDGITGFLCLLPDSNYPITTQEDDFQVMTNLFFLNNPV